MSRLIVSILVSLPAYVFLLHVITVSTGAGRAAYTHMGAVQLLVAIPSVALAPVVMPSIEVAELTPGRRMVRLVGRSGLISVAVGLVVAAIKAKLGVPV